MSWKSIVITGLLCVVASPVLAAPTVGAKLLGLDAAGNWVWQVNVTPDASLFTNSGPTGTPPNVMGGSVALEIGVTAAGRNLVNAAANATNFPNSNPATNIPGFGFWTAADSGLKTNVATNQLVAGLGGTFFTSATATEALLVRTQRPTTSALTTTLNFLGAYNANGTTGGALPGVAQGGALTGFAIGPAAKSVKVGNTNLDGNVDVVDLGILAGNYNQAGTFRWQDGDFSGDGVVNVVDLGDLAGTYNTADTNWTTPGTVAPGGGSGSFAGGGGVPEPSTMILFAMGGSLIAVLRRKRNG